MRNAGISMRNDQFPETLKETSQNFINLYEFFRNHYLKAESELKEYHYSQMPHETSLFYQLIDRFLRYITRIKIIFDYERNN